ncbi:MAG: hypothetical protein KatS3mg076_0866 [Candidatus Binatia bacterium]|nr:MAG: hypothetical protein KatS3mg076_0866 [Candidatus Binatia bacterium]
MPAADGCSLGAGCRSSGSPRSPMARKSMLKECERPRRSPRPGRDGARPSACGSGHRTPRGIAKATSTSTAPPRTRRSASLRQGSRPRIAHRASLQTRRTRSPPPPDATERVPPARIRCVGRGFGGPRSVVAVVGNAAGHPRMQRVRTFASPRPGRDGARPSAWPRSSMSGTPILGRGTAASIHPPPDATERAPPPDATERVPRRVATGAP